jgi:hypothetical protein
MKTAIVTTGLLGCVLVLSMACSEDDELAPHVHDSADSGAGGNGSGGNGGSGGVVDPHSIPDSGNTMCAEIGTYCHAFDEGTGLGAQCHETGHAGDEAACAAIYDECIAFCHSAHDEDAGDAGQHASVVCEELGHLCHDFDNGDSGLGHECHEVGHAGDEAACLAIQGDCLALCGGDAGQHDVHAGDGG